MKVKSTKKNKKYFVYNNIDFNRAGYFYYDRFGFIL